MMDKSKIEAFVSEVEHAADVYGFKIVRSREFCLVEIQDKNDPTDFVFLDDYLEVDLF